MTDSSGSGESFPPHPASCRMGPRNEKIGKTIIDQDDHPT